MSIRLPFILRFREEKRGEFLTPGTYSENHDLTVIKREGSIIPLVCAATNVLETKTITEAARERED